MGPKNKPKLLFVIHSLVIGGTENLVYQMSCQLKDKFEIGICCLDKQGLLWEKCEKQGFRLYNLNRKPGFQPQLVKSLREVIKEFSPDIVHSHQYTPFFYASLAKLLSRSKARFIFTEHGRHFPDVVSWKRKLVNKAFRVLPDVVTGVSQFTKDRLVENEGFRSDSIQVLYNGINTEAKNEHLDLREYLGLSSDQKIIGVLGSLREVKNPLFVLNSLPTVLEKYPEAILVYIGDGELRDEVNSKAKELGVSSNVKLAGNIVPATPYLSSFDCFVMGSLSEACSLALLEAMFAGVPAIVSDRGGSPELVVDGKYGQVVECDNQQELSIALKKVLAGDASIDKMALAARKRVKEEFSFIDMCAKYERLYGGGKGV